MARALATALLVCASGSSAGAAEVGPPRGALVVVGGGMQDPAIFQRFLRLAGGPEAPIMVIPTAGAEDVYPQFWSGLHALKKAGATNLSVLHTRDREVANSEEFVQPIRAAHGVWITGGRQWRLADSYLDTRTQEELRALLDRGGVIGGSSAGATIQGSYLARGDTSTNTVMMGDHEQGFAFLRNVAIDQHLLKRNRQFDLIEIVEARPELLGIGIDEDTAIVVRADTFEVIGQGYVAIYDHERLLGPAGRFFLLAPGDYYNLKDRRPTRRTLSPDPFSQVKEEAWPER